MSEKKAINPSRRQVLGTMGLVGAGVVLGACTPAMGTGATTGKKNQDADILNFALNLEYLEAAFYLAAVGRLNELTAAGGDASKVTLSSSISAANATNGTGSIQDATLKSIVNEIATDEVNHVKAIRATLGKLNATPVAQPQLDLSASFQTAGSLASNGVIANFDPYANDLFFLHGAFVFEDVGVTAYHGAATLVYDDSTGGVLDAAAGILAVEAYHAGYVRTVLFQMRATTTVAPLNVAQTVAAISALRASVGGGKDQGIVGDMTTAAAGPSGVTASSINVANLVPADSNSIAYSRSVAEVLAIVYLGGSGKGGFFPAGLNGTFK